MYTLRAYHPDRLGITHFYPTWAAATFPWLAWELGPPKAGAPGRSARRRRSFVTRRAATPMAQ